MGYGGWNLTPTLQFKQIGLKLCKPQNIEK